MSVRVSRAYTTSIVFLKLVYYYAKMLGMVYFSINAQARLETTAKSQLYSISYRLSCLIPYTFFLPAIFDDIFNIPLVHIRAMALIQLVSIVFFTSVFLVIQVMRQKQFISVVNKAIDVFFRILVTTGDANIFGMEFYFLFIGRFATNVLTIVMDSPRVVAAVQEANLTLVFQYLIGYCLWFGTLVMVDLLCLGYITASGLYRNIGQHMVSFIKRIEFSEGMPMTKFRRMQVLCEFCDELETCSSIYSEIFTITEEFHKLFQFNILITFYFDIIMIIGNIHYNFLDYINTGHIMWSFMAVGVIRTVDFLFLVLVVDMVVRRSRAPNCLDWDILCSDIDSRWDKIVDHFLNQMKIENLKMDVYGFFQLNNGLCLHIFSAIVAYLTILIQFNMLGYFKE